MVEKVMHSLFSLVYPRASPPLLCIVQDAVLSQPSCITCAPPSRQSNHIVIPNPSTGRELELADFIRELNSLFPLSTYARLLLAPDQLQRPCGQVSHSQACFSNHCCLI